MREIKFRAWDENLKRMFQVHTLGTKYSDTDILRFGTSSRDFDLMQFTGLHDKNGEAIYERDILEDTDTGSIKTVEYQGNSFALVDSKRFFYQTYHADEYKVIGNIYENPELLK